jgi:hypothetical protein
MKYDNVHIGDPVCVDHTIIPLLPAYKESVRDFPAVVKAREIVRNQVKHYTDMMEEPQIHHAHMPDREFWEYYREPFQKTPQVTPPFADSYFPVYTYRYDEQTNILTQYKNGVEAVLMFVPEPYDLKEIL